MVYVNAVDRWIAHELHNSLTSLIRCRTAKRSFETKRANMLGKLFEIRPWKKLSGKLELMAGLKCSSASFQGKRERRSGWMKLWPQVELLSKCAWRQSDGPCFHAIGFESTFLFIDAALWELFFPGIPERSGCGLNTASEKGFFSTFVQAVLHYSDRYELRPVLFVNCVYCLVWLKV